MQLCLQSMSQHCRKQASRTSPVGHLLPPQPPGSRQRPGGRDHRVQREAAGMQRVRFWGRALGTRHHPISMHACHVSMHRPYVNFFARWCKSPSAAVARWCPARRPSRRRMHGFRSCARRRGRCRRSSGRPRRDSLRQEETQCQAPPSRRSEAR